jgi:tocopherol cyclase
MENPSPLLISLHQKQGARYALKKTWNPSWFQGNGKKKNYFEGWYLKSVSENGEHSMAFIPGISINGTDSHSFVQAINGKTGQTWYFRYPLKAFKYSGKGFYVAIGPNFFSEKGLQLDLQNETGFFKGKLNFGDPTHFPVSLRRPGIMGWYRYVPFMECYHGVVSLDHAVDGSIEGSEEVADFNNGKGYIEKDWGSSMPEAWIWMQTNHFEQSGTSFMLSIAKIPWIGKSFTGFLGFFFHQGKLYPFATYTGAKVEKIDQGDEFITISVKAQKFLLEIKALKGEKGKLKAPVSGNMERVIHESIDASIQIELFDASKNLLFSGKGTNSGLEVVGDLSILSI